jgi:cytochrome b561
MLSKTRYLRLAVAVRSSARRTFSSAGAETPLAAEGIQSYSTGVKALHWAMGGATLGCFAFVNLAQQTKDKELKMDYMFKHKSFGTLAAALLVPRLAMRVISKHPGPVHAAAAAWEKMAATASHTAMYGFLIAMPATGVAMGYYGGKGLPFFFTTIPGASKESKNGKLAGQAFKIHKQLGFPMEMLFLAHLGGVGYHLANGHTILGRIVPGLL